jgi:hypothetical protein
MSGYGNDGVEGFQWETLMVSNFPADTWIYFLVRAKSQYLESNNPHTQAWVAVGNGAASKVVDNTKPNLDNAAVEVFRQVGLYTDYWKSNANQTTGANNWPTEYQWWDTGDSIEVLMKEYLVAPQWRADIEPPLWLVDQWFNELRSR